MKPSLVLLSIHLYFAKVSLYLCTSLLLINLLFVWSGFLKYVIYNTMINLTIEGSACPFVNVFRYQNQQFCELEIYLRLKSHVRELIHIHNVN